MEYHKIQSIYKRDPDNNYKSFLEGEWTRPEFRYLLHNEWVFDEKIDGTNIRIVFNEDGSIQFFGRTDRAQLHPDLLTQLKNLFPDNCASLFEGKKAILYGEGYGAGIQKVGVNYGPTKDFILFDASIEGMWLDREGMRSVGHSLGLDVVPEIAQGTLESGIEMCRHGFNSLWGDFEAEGVVARPAQELTDRRGNRIITKIKCVDFK